MCPEDRFIIHHRKKGPVYSSNEIRGVIAYLWGRDRRNYWVLVYEVPIGLRDGNLHALERQLYDTVLRLTSPHGVEIPL